MLRTELIRTVPELLAGHARSRPDKIAFVDEHRSVNYDELFDATARLAGQLQARGLGHGDRVLICMDNRVEVVEAYLAVPRANGVAVCANPGAALPEIAHILDDCGARFVVTDLAHVEFVRELAGERDDLVVIVADGQHAAVGGELVLADLLVVSGPDPRDGLGLDEAGWMLYTSGTTGRPKGVYLTQRGCLWDVAASFGPALGLDPEDVVLSALPLFHSYALVLCVLGIAAVGASERILTRFSVQAVLEHLAEPGPEGAVTVFPGVPTMFHYLCERVGDSGVCAPSLRVCMSAGATMSAGLNERFEKAFGVMLLDGYGITETSTMVTMNWPTGERVMGSCGLPLPGSGVRLVDPATLRDVPAGQEGELWVQGPHVSPGYHNLPEATAEVFCDGWYRTGDLGCRDENGFLRITGRLRELIIRGGENIYPTEVEAVLACHDAIVDAAVVGAPDDALGEVPVAFVVPREPEGFDPEAVAAWCRERLAGFKVPVRWVPIGEIPRTGSGKILRFRLQQQLASPPEVARADR
jgi:rifamycin polyketide synthase module 1/2/3